MFTNCRAGMMFWVAGILCFAKKNQELHGGNLQLGMAVNIAIQLIYLSKFYYWEMGKKIMQVLLQNMNTSKFFFLL
jgi:7-dehydrocholesterol reductase